VAAEEKNGTIAITIEDDGLGIEQSLIDEIFYSEDSFASDNYFEKGFKYGLKSVKKFIDLQNAKIIFKPKAIKEPRLQLFFRQRNVFSTLQKVGLFLIFFNDFY
jgi:sensor histidine kinase regulating citrate/malate metabolism